MPAEKLSAMDEIARLHKLLRQHITRCFLNSRIVKRISKVSVLDNATFADVMDSLRSCWRSREAPTAEKPISDDKFWIRLLKCDGEMLVAQHAGTGHGRRGCQVQQTKATPKRQRMPSMQTNRVRRNGARDARGFAPSSTGRRARGRPRKGTSSIVRRIEVLLIKWQTDYRRFLAERFAIRSDFLSKPLIRCLSSIRTSRNESKRLYFIRK